jgi:hypothetical protein
VNANCVAYIEHHGDIIGGGQFSLLALMGHLPAYEALMGHLPAYEALMGHLRSRMRCV